MLPRRVSHLARAQANLFQTIAEVYKPAWPRKIEKVLDVLKGIPRFVIIIHGNTPAKRGGCLCAWGGLCPTVDINRLMDGYMEKANEAANTQIGQKLKVAKEYAKVEMAPPNIGEIQKLKADLKLMKDFLSSGAYKYMTVKQFWLMVLVVTEVALWFFLGETVGKFHIVGYKV